MTKASKQKEQILVQWQYQGQPIESPPEWAIGMVYKISTHIAGEQTKYYIGKKSLTHSNRKKIGVRAKKASGTRKTYETIVKDSGWRAYTGSCRPLNALIREMPTCYQKEVLEWAYSKKNLHYLEMKYQYQYAVLEQDSWNDNIGGRIWRKDVSKELYDSYKEKLSIYKPKSEE